MINNKNKELEIDRINNALLYIKRKEFKVRLSKEILISHGVSSISEQPDPYSLTYSKAYPRQQREITPCRRDHMSHKTNLACFKLSLEQLTQQ